MAYPGGMTDGDALEELLAEAGVAYETDLGLLQPLSDDERDALEELVSAPGPEDVIEPVDDEVAHLTEEEWAYIVEVTDD